MSDVKLLGGEYAEIIKEKLLAAGITIDESTAEKLVLLGNTMLEYNEKVNLTRITEPDEIIEKHYIDSILPFTMTNIPEGSSVADIGTGAGFPAVPLMIWRSDLKLTLVDSLGKRITYLDFLLEKLGLNSAKTAKTVHARSEELGQNSEYRESFDIVTARAVASLPVLAEWCLPLVKVGGKFIALKGSEDEAKTGENAIKILGGKLVLNKRYELPSGDERRLIVIEKAYETGKRYPRNGGQIAKKPL